MSLLLLLIPGMLASEHGAHGTVVARVTTVSHTTAHSTTVNHTTVTVPASSSTSIA